MTEKLLRTGSVDLSYSIPQKTRFRVNVFTQRGSYSIVLRVIPNRIPTVEELGIPPQLNEITRERTASFSLPDRRDRANRRRLRL